MFIVGTDELAAFLRGDPDQVVGIPIAVGVDRQLDEFNCSGGRKRLACPVVREQLVDYALPASANGWKTNGKWRAKTGESPRIENETQLQRPRETWEGSRGPLHLNQPQFLSNDWGPPPSDRKITSVFSRNPSASIWPSTEATRLPSCHEEARFSSNSPRGAAIFPDRAQNMTRAG